jgi:hypothetical protein
VNLGTLHLEQRRQVEARVELGKALTDPGLDVETRREASVALAMLDEHDRLAPAITEAVAQESDVPILRQIASVSTASLRGDERMLEFFGKIAAGASAAAASSLVRDASVGAGWPAVEAHFALHLGDEPDAILHSTRYLAAHAVEEFQTTSMGPDRDLQRHFRAVLCRRAAAPPEGDGAAWEARTRFWHAMLTWEHFELFPGQFKPTPNYVRLNPLVARTRPEDVAGTIRRLFAGAYRDVPPGPGRAALVHFAISEIHGFRDGNGRLARFLANYELEQAGYPPVVLTDRTSKSVAAALVAVRVMTDLEPLVELFARASQETVSLLDRLEAHAATAGGPAPGAVG